MCEVREWMRLRVACIYFFCGWFGDYRIKKYRLPCMLLSERKVGDWLSIFSCENGKKKETSWDKVERHNVKGGE